MRDRETVRQIMWTLGVIQTSVILCAFLIFEKPFTGLFRKQVDNPKLPSENPTSLPLDQGSADHIPDVIAPNVPKLLDEARQDIQI